MTSPASQKQVIGKKNGRPACWLIRWLVKDKKKDVKFYQTLYTAALRGDWESAKNFLNKYPNSVTAEITDESETALHIAVGTGKAIHFVKELVDRMPDTALALVNKNGETPLSVATIVGNIEAAKLLVKRNPDLANTRNRNGGVPLHDAAKIGHREMVRLLLGVTRDDTEPSPFTGEYGVLLLVHVIVAGFYDVALYLIERYPALATLATLQVNDENNPLSVLARKPSAFSSGSGFNFWQRFIYSCVPVKLENFPHNLNGEDYENQVGSSRCWIFKVFQNLHEVVGELVPQIKHIQDKKLMHHQAYQVVKYLCMKIAKLENSKAVPILKNPLISAAKLGIHEVVELIVESFPSAIWFSDEENHSIFHLAVMYRQEKVFNLLYKMSKHRQWVIQSLDKFNNNILHLAGNLPPQHLLNLVSGAALQVQHEKQWYKEVENFVQPFYKEMVNCAGKSPYMVFKDEHKYLVKNGEKRMEKNVVKALIVAVVIVVLAVLFIKADALILFVYA